MKKVIIIIFAIFIFLFCGISVHGQNNDIIVKRDTLIEATISADKIVAKPTYIIKPKEIHTTISAMGEPDAIKFIQTLPGVSSGMEGTSAFYVRGGNMGNNLITLDGVTIFGSSHLMGFASILPSSIIERTDFFVGGFTSEDGNLLSSHIKMTSKEGDFRKFHTQASISNIMASAMFTAPIVKEKLSFIFSGRWSPAAYEYNAISGMFDTSIGLPNKIKADVFDIFGKLNWKLSSRNDISFSFFTSNDIYEYKIGAKSNDMLGWSNMTGNIVWNFNINKKWVLKTNTSYNEYNSRQRQGRKVSDDDESMTYIQLQSMIKEFRFSSTAHYIISDKFNIQFGGDFRLSDFNPGSLKSFNSVTSGVNNWSRNYLSSLHAQTVFGTKKINIRGAARVNWFKSGSFSRILPEVRLYASWFFLENYGLEFTADYLNQYYHTLEGIPTGISLDMIVPAGEYAEPEKACQLYFGTMGRFTQGIKISLGGFYKKMYNLVFFREADSFFSSTFSAWKDGLDIGTGTSYGLEFLAQIERERFSAKIAYTLSKTDRVYPHINDGHPIPFKFDRRHILNTNASYIVKKTEKTEHGLSAAFILSSGHYESIQAGTYPGMMPFEEEDGDINDYFQDIKFFTHPNNYRLPMYIRVDIGYNMTVHRETCSHTLSVGIFNLLNRHNAYSLYYDSTDQRWKKLSILPIMPSLKYTFDF